ncbi:MAG TPA: hypothetical protein PLP61_14085, partial [Nocardioides sp.]|uniref:hypothetical protein n=1 Tax=Nocardioides sp. TaxID=35761 RepID=UPI002CCBB6E8
MTPPPGGARQGTARTVFRVLGIALGGLGLVLVVVGFYRFATGGVGDQAQPAFFMFVSGGVLLVVGFGLLSAGFMGAGARYAAGETAPVVKDSAAYLSDGEGILGVGRTARGPAAAGGASGAAGTSGVRGPG